MPKHPKVVRKLINGVSEAAMAYDGPSKTTVKKEMLELQELGIALAELPEAQFNALDLEERLREALTEMRRLKAHSARKRQSQFIGKLLQGVDVQPLQRALAARQLAQARNVRALQEIELWRTRLIADEQGFAAWAKAHPEGDTPQLRSLVRDAIREKNSPSGGNGPAYRELFKSLRAVLGAAG